MKKANNTYALQEPATAHFGVFKSKARKNTLKEVRSKIDGLYDAHRGLEDGKDRTVSVMIEFAMWLMGELEG